MASLTREERETRKLLLATRSLPYEAQVEILINIPFYKLEPVCEEWFSDVCSDEYFWARKAQKDYGRFGVTAKMFLKDRMAENRPKLRYQQIMYWYECPSGKYTRFRDHQDVFCSIMKGKFRVSNLGEFEFGPEAAFSALLALNILEHDAQNGNREALISLRENLGSSSEGPFNRKDRGKATALSDKLQEIFAEYLVESQHEDENEAEDLAEITASATRAFFMTRPEYEEIEYGETDEDQNSDQLRFYLESIKASAIGKNKPVFDYIVSKCLADFSHSAEHIRHVTRSTVRSGQLELVKSLVEKHILLILPTDVREAYRYNHPKVLSFLLDYFSSDTETVSKMKKYLRDMLAKEERYKGASPDFLYGVYGGDDYDRVDEIAREFIGDSAKEKGKGVSAEADAYIAKVIKEHKK